jgi:hypothetical protein
VTTQSNPPESQLSRKIGRCTALGTVVTNPISPTLSNIRAVAPDMPRWCIALSMAVYTGHGGDHLHVTARDRGQVGTALGVAVPPDKQGRYP